MTTQGWPRTTCRALSVAPRGLRGQSDASLSMSLQGAFSPTSLPGGTPGPDAAPTPGGVS